MLEGELQSEEKLDNELNIIGARPGTYTFLSYNLCSIYP